MVMDYAALLSLVPAALLLIRPRPQRDSVTWSLLLVAVVGPASLVAVQNAGGWQASLSGALWVSAAAALILFAVTAALNESAWRLLPLLAAYCLLLGLAATLFAAVPREALPHAASPAWLDLHIAVSLATYGLATIAAVAGLCRPAAGAWPEAAAKQRVLAEPAGRRRWRAPGAWPARRRGDRARHRRGERHGDPVSDVGPTAGFRPQDSLLAAGLSS